MTVAIGLYTPEGVALFADRRISFGSAYMTTSKLFKAGRWHFAIAGYTAAIVPFRNALTPLTSFDDLRPRAIEALQAHNWEPNSNEGGPNTVDFRVLITDGQSLWFMPGDFTPVLVDGPFYAIGSGSDYALGALAAGATPDRAVQIAAQFDNNCGDVCDEIRLSKPKKRSG